MAFGRRLIGKALAIQRTRLKDLASTFADVVRITQEALDLASGWGSLVRYLEEQARQPLSELRSVDVREDVQDVREQLQELLRSEPSPSGLNAVYFGLFDALDGAGDERVGYYVSGVKAFDARDGDSLLHPAWWPDGRYLASAALDAIKEAELQFATAGKRELRALLGYSGQLGAALLVSRFASDGLFPGLHRVVGFDSGDFAEIAS